MHYPFLLLAFLYGVNGGSVGNSSSSRNYEDIAETMKNCDCGKSNFGIRSCEELKRSVVMDRIVGGRRVLDKEIPWQAMINICPENINCYICGGALLNHQFVSSAAHCFQLKGSTYEPYRMKVHLGQNDRRRKTRFYKIMSVKKVIIHEGFDESSLLNDIALVKLERPIFFNPGVSPLCLPPTNKPFYHRMAIVSGWGQEDSKIEVETSFLKRTHLKVLEPKNPICRNGVGGTPEPTELCAYVKGTDACGGDSGGPLALSFNRRCSLIGIVSYGNGCARPGYAGIYTRVTKYIDWIIKHARSGGCMYRHGEKIKLCDLICKIGKFTGSMPYDGTPLVCASGRCHAINPDDDICQKLNYPCN